MMQLTSSFLLLVLLIQMSFGQEDEYLIKRFKDHNGAVLSVAISPDSKYLASGGEDKKLIIYQLANYDIAYEYADNYFPPRALLFTGDNKLFLGAGSDIKLIDLSNNQLALLKGNTTHIWSVSYAPERNKVAAGSYDYKLKVWDLGSQQVELELTGHKKSTLPVAFSPDEKYLASGSLDMTVRLWNAKTGELLKTLERHSENIYDIAFHPTGKYLASASRDKTIRLWDFEKGEVVQTYAGHDQGVTDVEFLPDGKHLLSASYDGSVRLWETKTGKMVYTYSGHEGAINSIAVSSDGNIFATAGSDQHVMVYKIDKKVFVEYAFYEEFMTEKENISLFDERRKGEKKDDFEKRQIKAVEKETEIVGKYYQQYLKQLGTLEFR